MTSIIASSIIALTNLCGAVSVDAHGARVVSYVPNGGKEVFFASETGTGGMPLCWPWFGGNGPTAGSHCHGIARYCDFDVAMVTNRSPCDSELTMRLKSNDATRRLFPHDFALTVSVRLTDRLAVSMTGENTGREPFEVTEAFHPYFVVCDSGKCRVEGMDAPECRLTDSPGGRILLLMGEGGGRRVWRPSAESHLSKSVSPIMPYDWKKFICVENGTFTRERAYILRPGESHTLICSIRAGFTANRLTRDNPKE